MHGLRLGNRKRTAFLAQEEAMMKRFAVIILMVLIFQAITFSANAQEPNSHSVMLTVSRVPWLSGVGAEYQYRYKNWGFGADFMFGRNLGAVRGLSSHAIVKGHLPLVEGLSAFLSLGVGLVHTWSEYSPDYLYFNPYLAGGFEGRYKWFAGMLEVGYGPGISDYVIHTTYVKFGLGVTF